MARCEGCPFDVLVKAIADEVAKRLCPREPSPERLISPAEAARRLGISRRSLDRMRRSVPFVKERPSGHGYAVIESALAEYIKEH